MTALASYFAWQNGTIESETEFRVRSQAVRDAITSRLRTYRNALTQTRGLFYADTFVSREEFRAYVESMNLAKEYPGSHGVGYAVRIRPGKSDELVGYVRNSGLPGFKVWPIVGDVERFPILYIEPLDPTNQRALGYDMASEPARRAAMERARDLGEAVATGMIRLVQEGDAPNPQPGFNIYVPVYGTRLLPPTVEARRRELRGFIYSPFRANELFNAIFGYEGDSTGLLFAIFDGDEPRPERLLYANHTDVAGARARGSYHDTTRIDAVGHPWTLETVLPPVMLPARTRYLPFAVLAFGSLLSIVLFFTLRLIQANAEKLRKNDELLREENRITETLYRIGRLLASELDLQRLVQALTDATTELTGARFGAFFYNVNQGGEKLMLFTLSGAPVEAFSKFPLPRRTALFGPTFDGEGILRIDDVTKDPRFGRNPPYHGMPKGHLPVRSYLAVPVVSRSGEVLGGLFFGHSEAGVFPARLERVMSGIASQAAVAMDNARLYAEAQRAIQRKEESLAELARSNAELEQFAYVASHDLKEPLRMVSSFVQLLERRYRDKLDEQAREFIGFAVEGTARMHTLIHDLLEYSSVRTKGVPFRRTSAEAVLSATLKNLQAAIFESGAEITHGELPEILVDPTQATQLFQNVIGNAIKYRRERPRVHVDARREGDQWVFSVKDNGIGIPAEYFERIFVIFQRLHGRDEYSGTGIGLAVCKRIVERHGGRMWVESTPGKGSTFFFTLPSVEAAAAVEGAAPRAEIA